jgi:hypothetical protein
MFYAKVDIILLIFTKNISHEKYNYLCIYAHHIL